MLDYLFGFRGTIGRVRMWLTYLTCTSAMIVVPVPHGLDAVEVHKTSMGGTFDASYLYVDGRLDLQGWIAVLAFLAVELLLLWIILAAIVRRLHDHGFDGRWLLLPIAGFAILDLMTLFVLPEHGDGISAAGILALLVLVVTALPGAYGAFLVFILRGFGPPFGADQPRPPVRSFAS
jgi:uncharacterized membrane protein YhaH (DUF805 family)